MIIKHCALCGPNEKLRIRYPATFTEQDLNKAIFSARRLPDRIHYRIMECGNCGMIFSSPILPPGKITRLYRESSCTYSNLLPYVTQTYIELFDGIAGGVEKNPNVLEIGCGNGFFLDRLWQKGVRCVRGVEPGADMVRKAPSYLRRRIVRDVLKRGQFRDGFFDIVCCFHTLDHVTDPKQFLREVQKILAPGGIFLVVVHDTDGISVRLLGERSPIFDIEHIYLFNKHTLAALCGKVGLTTARTFDLKNTYPLWYWVRMSGLPQPVKNWAIRVLKTFRLAEKNFSLAGGNIALVARKPG